MKKYICVILFLIVFANFAIAQEAAGEVEQSSAISFSFFNIILSSGILGILVWAVILTMLPFASILGIVSIICSVKSDGSKLPLSFKWLILSPLFYFFVGAVGVIIGVLSFGQVLAAEQGSPASGAMIALGISSTLNTAIFTLLGMVPFFFFMLICMLILHFKRLPSPLVEEVSHE